jgi:hypothetical protein
LAGAGFGCAFGGSLGWAFAFGASSGAVGGSGAGASFTVNIFCFGIGVRRPGRRAIARACSSNETANATATGRSRYQGRSNHGENSSLLKVALVIASGWRPVPQPSERVFQTHENHELHLLILMWVAGPEVAENASRLYLPVGTPVGVRRPGDLR